MAEYHIATYQNAEL